MKLPVLAASLTLAALPAFAESVRVVDGDNITFAAAAVRKFSGREADPSETQRLDADRAVGAHCQVDSESRLVSRVSAVRIRRVSGTKSPMLPLMVSMVLGTNVSSPASNQGSAAGGGPRPMGQTSIAFHRTGFVTKAAIGLPAGPGAFLAA